MERYVRLVLVRHGQSVYNRQGLFTGWSDVELSPQGVLEAKEAGRVLKEEGIYPYVCFTSYLKRAIHTAQLLLREMEWEHIECHKSYRLNERHYGAWQGLHKEEVKQMVGEDVFKAVRRGYEARPPLLEPNDRRSARFEAKYADIDDAQLPLGESLADTRKRVSQYYFSSIAPELARGKDVLVSAHGNSLRALIMMLERLTPHEVETLEVPTARPVVYELDNELGILDTKTLMF